jgi:hypothetical protein
VPLKIAVQTMVGMSVIEASQWKLQDEAHMMPASNGRKPAADGAAAGTASTVAGASAAQ